jgi:hypothetical protein
MDYNLSAVAIALLIYVGIPLFIYMGKKNAVSKVYDGYYVEKRRKFEWLGKWIKDCGFNPVELRKNEAINQSIISTTLIYFFIAFIVAGLLQSLISFFVGGFLHNSTLTPSEFEYHLYMNIGTALSILVAFIICKVRMKNFSDPTSVDSPEGLTFECPSCGCPHSWVMLRSQNSVDSEWEERVTTTTTTTRTTSADSYGGGFIGGLFSAATSGSRTDSSTEVTKCFGGKTDRSFKCLNCGHTHDGSYPQTWYYTRPDEEERFYDPPMSAWRDAARIKKSVKQTNFILFAVIFLLTAGFLIRGYTDASDAKETATHVHEATIDPSMNAVSTSHYTGVKIRKEPRGNSEEIGRIPSGVFFTSYEKSGKYTRVEYKGQQGWVFSEAIKKLSKNRTATISRRNTKVKLEPEKDAKETLLNKGNKVTLLGENDGGLIKIEFAGKVYWTSAYYLYW